MSKIPLKTIFQANSGGFSSKRICGVLGWFVCLIVFMWAFIVKAEVPDFGDMVIIMSSSLLGIESVASIFSKKVTKQ